MGLLTAQGLADEKTAPVPDWKFSEIKAAVDASNPRQIRRVGMISIKQDGSLAVHLSVPDATTIELVRDKKKGWNVVQELDWSLSDIQKVVLGKKNQDAFHIYAIEILWEGCLRVEAESSWEMLSGSGAQYELQYDRKAGEWKITKTTYFDK